MIVLVLQSFLVVVFLALPILCSFPLCQLYIHLYLLYLTPVIYIWTVCFSESWLKLSLLTSWTCWRVATWCPLTDSSYKLFTVSVIYNQSKEYPIKAYLSWDFVFFSVQVFCSETEKILGYAINSSSTIISIIACNSSSTIDPVHKLITMTNCCHPLRLKNLCSDC